MRVQKTRGYSRFGQSTRSLANAPRTSRFDSKTFSRPTTTPRRFAFAFGWSDSFAFWCERSERGLPGWCERSEPLFPLPSRERSELPGVLLVSLSRFAANTRMHSRCCIPHLPCGQRWRRRNSPVARFGPALSPLSVKRFGSLAPSTFRSCCLLLAFPIGSFPIGSYVIPEPADQPRRGLIGDQLESLVILFDKTLAERFATRAPIQSVAKAGIDSPI